MPRQPAKGNRTTGKGSRQKREAAFTRHAAGHSMQHHDFVGDAQPDRAEAEFLRIDRLQQEKDGEAVREMAGSLAHEAGLDGGLHRPHSLREGVELLNHLRSPEAREELREKARERLLGLPQPVQFALQVAERLATAAMGPVQRGVKLVSEALRVPGALLRGLHKREA